jgi:transposase
LEGDVVGSGVRSALTLSEAELADYCRRQVCKQANATQQELNREEHEQVKAAPKRIKELARDSRRDKAVLAEAAALLVLSKKSRRWRRSEDE